MKISYNWLKEYVNLDDVTPTQLADALTNSGLEIEEVMPLASATNIVIAEVLTCEKHPDADTLNVTTVEYGDGPVQIVCGAPNVKAGIKVIVAKVGAVLPAITIKQAQVRGQESNGMICSLLEIGVAEKYLSPEQIDGIEILSDDAPVGSTDVLSYLGIDDVVLDASQTPNRADCMAMWNVAKEVGAILRRKATWPNCECAAGVGSATKLAIQSNTEKCPHFLGKVIGSVTVKESPKWMQNHLHAAGIKSINNVVDISNYVMIETGQPLHFYDISKVENQEITVVDNVNTKLVALDGNEYDVIEGDIVITNNGRPTGLAGIMGGDDSKIDENTKGIIIEAALFNHVSIRNTAKRLGLNTESSSRFTKGIEPLAQFKAMDRAVQLLIELADATLIEETIEFGEVDYEPTVVVQTITNCNKLLGTDFTAAQVKDVLMALDFQPEFEGDKFLCVIPSYRTDILIPQDIDEEIIRLIGYDSLKETLPTMEATSGQLNNVQKLRRSTKNVLNGFGLNEIITYTLVNQKYIDNACMPFGTPVALASPMSEERKYVRNSLIHSMVECLSYNEARKAKNVNLFEISNVYQENQVQERLGIILNGSLQSSKLHRVDIKNDFYTLKGIIVSLFEKLGFQGSRVVIKANDIDHVNFHPYRSAVVLLQNKVIGIFGELHPSLLKEKNISSAIYGEIILDALIANKATKVKFQPLDKYPSVNRDIALICKDDVEASSLMKTITSTSRLVKNVDIFDVYQGEHVEKGYKSIALSITYQADHTLNEEEINEIHNKVLQNLQNKCQATLRT